MNLNALKQKLFAAKQTFDYRLEKVLFGLAEQICDLLEGQEVSRTDLARKMNVSPAYITKILNGNPNLTIKSLLKLSDALGQDLKIQFSPKAEVVCFSAASEQMTTVHKPTEFEHMRNATPRIDSTITKVPTIEACNDLALAA